MIKHIAKLQKKTEALRAQVLRLEEVFNRSSQVRRLERLIDEVQQALKEEISDNGFIRPPRVSVAIRKGGIQEGIDLIGEESKQTFINTYQLDLMMAQARAARVMTSEEFIHACNSLINAVRNGTWSFKEPQT